MNARRSGDSAVVARVMRPILRPVRGKPTGTMRSAPPCSPSRTCPRDVMHSMPDCRTSDCVIVGLPAHSRSPGAGNPCCAKTARRIRSAGECGSGSTHGQRSTGNAPWLVVRVAVGGQGGFLGLAGGLLRGAYSAVTGVARRVFQSLAQLLDLGHAIEVFAGQHAAQITHQLFQISLGGVDSIGKKMGLTHIHPFLGLGRG